VTKKQTKESIFIVIPAYNEGERIKKVINELQGLGYKSIVVIDDGSKDNTFEVLKSIKGIHVLRHIVNRGQGATLQTGTDYALTQNPDFIIHFDADGQHDTADIPAILETLKNGSEMALGTRFHSSKKAQNIPLSKVITLKLGTIVTWIISGIMLTDTHNGFRAFKPEAAKVVKITLDRFEHASEILDLVKIKKLKYKEVPVTIKYLEYGQKISNSVNILKNIVLHKLNDILYR
jgi:glycosyltransferase involved in cell wall biosynthesis